MSDTDQEKSVTTRLKEAVKAVEQADVPDDLRQAAFERAFDALAEPFTEAAERLSPTGSQDSAAPSLQTVAKRLNVDSETLGDIYHVDDQGLALGVAPSRFENRRAPATKQIALLVAAGRQAGGWDEWTPVQAIREVVRDFGRFDSANFATTIKGMGDVFNVRGRGQRVEVRVTRPGYERASQLIRDLTGD